MTGELVLITGVTGHIGFRVLRYALEYGYQVKAVVRSEAKASIIRTHPLLQQKNDSSRISFAIVPNFTASQAFDTAVQDAQYIIHVASPLATEVPLDGDLERHFVQPAVTGTFNLLRSAKEVGTVKRIVITSSFSAIVPPPALFGIEPSDTVYNAENRLPEIEPPYPNSIVAYTAAKIAALNRAEEWVRDTRPGFDLIHIFPSFVYGRDDLCTETRSFQTGTNRFPLNVALGKPDPQGIPAMPNSYNHVDDCARVHVLALDSKVQGNQGFLVSSTGQDGMTWEVTYHIVEKHFPGAVKSGVLPVPNKAAYGTVVLKLDNRKTEETFGFRHADYEQTVVSVIRHYLELLAAESSVANGTH